MLQLTGSSRCPHFLRISDDNTPIEANPQAAAKVQAIERERSAEWVAYLTMATSQRNGMLDREDEQGSVFSWGSRPAMS